MSRSEDVAFDELDIDAQLWILTWVDCNGADVHMEVGRGGKRPNQKDYWDTDIEAACGSLAEMNFVNGRGDHDQEAPNGVGFWIWYGDVDGDFEDGSPNYKGTWRRALPEELVQYVRWCWRRHEETGDQRHIKIPKLAPEARATVSKVNSRVGKLFNVFKTKEGTIALGPGMGDYMRGALIRSDDEGERLSISETRFEELLAEAFLAGMLKGEQDVQHEVKRVLGIREQR